MAFHNRGGDIGSSRIRTPVARWMAIAIVAGVLVAGIPLALITAFTSYVTTAYHTCLFLWAREAEKAVGQGQSAQMARVPAPLAAVLAH